MRITKEMLVKVFEIWIEETKTSDPKPGDHEWAESCADYMWSILEEL